MPIAAGTSIGPYEIVGWLGAGGMGEVYRARDPRLGRDVAIKLIPETFATDASRVRRFEQEARAAGQLNHPNILAVYDVGTHGGAPYIVSELLEGESLRAGCALADHGAVRRRKGWPLPVRKAIDYARQIAEGLAAAHDKGIVHRDVKPDNLFITSDGRIKILDFGIAKLTRPNDDAARHLGSRHGDRRRHGASAPRATCRRSRSAAKPSMRRSDLFSFGTILYEMLTGRPAFTRETAAETMAAILKEDPPLLPGRRVAGARAHRLALSRENARDAVSVGARSGVRLESLPATRPPRPRADAVGARRRWRTAVGVAVVRAESRRGRGQLASVADTAPADC